MRKTDLFKLVWTNLWRMKVRTFLTTAGVAIGTTAIVAMVSLGAGMQKNLTEQLGNMGTITEITVSPKYDFTAAPSSSGDLPDPVKPLDDKALKEIKKIDGVAAVLPVVSLDGAELAFGRYHAQISAKGIDPNEANKSKVKLDRGRYLNRGDRYAVILGYKASENFKDQAASKSKGRLLGKKSSNDTSKEDGTPDQQGFFWMNPGEKAGFDLLQKTIPLSVKKYDADGNEEIKTLRVRVVGILAETGGFDDYGAIMPLETVKSLLSWRDGKAGGMKNRYETIKVIAATPDTVERVQHEIEGLGFSPFSMKQMLAAINSISRVIQAVLGGIGGIALFVAAFGIMNTMIMSIYERTKEIGIMKTIGASINDIKRIFLLEAGCIGFLGGIIGLIIGWISTQLINFAASVYFTSRGGNPIAIVYVPLWLGIFAVSFSATVGLLSGLYPAMRAARLSPLKALRHE